MIAILKPNQFSDVLTANSDPGAQAGRGHAPPLFDVLFDIYLNW